MGYSSGDLLGQDQSPVPDRFRPQFGYAVQSLSGSDEGLSALQHLPESERDSEGAFPVRPVYLPAIHAGLHKGPVRDLHPKYLNRAETSQSETVQLGDDSSFLRGLRIFCWYHFDSANFRVGRWYSYRLCPIFPAFHLLDQSLPAS